MYNFIKPLIYLSFSCSVLNVFAQNTQNNNVIIINGDVVNSNIGITNNSNSERQNYNTSTSSRTNNISYRINDEFFEQLSKLASLSGKKSSYFSFDSSGRVKFIDNNIKRYGSYEAVKTDGCIIVSIQWDRSRIKEDIIMNRWSKIFTYQAKEYKATTSIR